MKYEIIQTAPYPTAEFTFQRKSGDIGIAKRTCDKKTWKVEIRFDGISMLFIKVIDILRKPIWNRMDTGNSYMAPLSRNT